MVVPSALVAIIDCSALWLQICHRHICLTRRAPEIASPAGDIAFQQKRSRLTKHWGKAICFVLLTAASYTLYYYIKNWAAIYGGQHYNLSFLIVVAGFFQPMLLALLGYTGIYTLQQFAQFPAPIPQYQSIHRILWVFLFVSCALYVPQVYWCCAELLRLSGILPLEQALPTYNIFFPKHFWLLETYPMIWRCAYTLCGAGIAITSKKSAEG